jgi:vancomycin permeability regulator SanA
LQKPIRDDVEPIGLEAGLFGKAMKEEFMRLKLLVAAAAIAALATPALAAEFYIVQDTTTKRCTIVEQKPTTQTTTIVGNGKTYTTRQEAEGAMKTVKVCESGGTVGGPVPVPR